MGNLGGGNPGGDSAHLLAQLRQQVGDNATAAASAAAMNQAGASYPGVSSELAEILRNVDPQALPAVLAQLQQATSGLNGGTDTGGGGQ